MAWIYNRDEFEWINTHHIVAITWGAQLSETNKRRVTVRAINGDSWTWLLDCNEEDDFRNALKFHPEGRQNPPGFARTRPG